MGDSTTLNVGQKGDVAPSLEGTESIWPISRSQTIIFARTVP